jgi:cytochrome c-type biogenesis protein CcmE
MSRCRHDELRHCRLAVLRGHTRRLRSAHGAEGTGPAALTITPGETQVAVRTPPGAVTGSAASPGDAGRPQGDAGRPQGKGTSVGAESSPAPHVLAGPRARRSLGTRRQKVVAAIVIVAALGFLVARGLANAMNYYLTANQAVAQRAQLGSSAFRIQGTVLPGVHQVGTTLHFSITAQHVDVDVVSSGSPPELFHVGMPVVLAGHWQGNIFSSSQIMVQHGSNYVEAHPGKSGASGNTT